MQGARQHTTDTKTSPCHKKTKYSKSSYAKRLKYYLEVSSKPHMTIAVLSSAPPEGSCCYVLKENSQRRNNEGDEAGPSQHQQTGVYQKSHEAHN